MANGFIDARLLEEIDYGFQRGPSSRTEAVTQINGVVRRRALWSRPHYSFVASYDGLSEVEMRAVINAHTAAQGRAFAFRFKDHADFTATNEGLGLATGVAQQVQLIKSYTFGSRTIIRNIRKPVTGTVVVKANGVVISAVTDYTTGIVTVTATAGQTLSWSGEFDVPVMFTNDELSISNPEFDQFKTSVALDEDITQ